MRVLVPRRFIRLGILVAALCLTPALSPSAVFAYPKPFQDTGDNPPGPRGDGDGTVVKGARMNGISIGVSQQAMGGRKSNNSAFERYLRLFRMGYGLRWYW
jgi:hypothetical protein